jgi:hypothetical protein
MIENASTIHPSSASRAVPNAGPSASDDYFSTAPTAFWIGATAHPSTAIKDAAAQAGTRILSATDYAGASAALALIASVDVIWLDYAGDGPGAALCGQLRMMAAEHGCQIILSVSMDHLDQAVADFGDDADSILCDPDAADLVFAMASPVMRFHDIVQDPHSSDLTQLYQEVSRISMMLSRLTQGDANRFASSAQGAAPGTAAIPASPFIDDHVAMPRRTYQPEQPLAAGQASSADLNYAPSQRAALVRKIIRARRMREQFFASDMFADPAWDMLLDLYVARLERGQVSVSSLCIAAAVPATTALRWIKSMSDAGLFVRQDDPQDGRRVFIALGDDAKSGLDRYFTLAEREGVLLI